MAFFPVLLTLPPPKQAGLVSPHWLQQPAGVMSKNLLF
jgi:hypothetical protein